MGMAYRHMETSIQWKIILSITFRSQWHRAPSNCFLSTITRRVKYGARAREREREEREKERDRSRPLFAVFEISFPLNLRRGPRSRICKIYDLARYREETEGSEWWIESCDLTAPWSLRSRNERRNKKAWTRWEREEKSRSALRHWDVGSRAWEQY